MLVFFGAPPTRLLLALRLNASDSGLQHIADVCVDVEIIIRNILQAPLTLCSTDTLVFGPPAAQFAIS